MNNERQAPSGNDDLIHALSSGAANCYELLAARMEQLSNADMLAVMRGNHDTAIERTAKISLGKDFEIDATPVQIDNTIASLYEAGRTLRTIVTGDTHAGVTLFDSAHLKTTLVTPVLGRHDILGFVALGFKEPVAASADLTAEIERLCGYFSILFQLSSKPEAEQSTPSDIELFTLVKDEALMAAELLLQRDALEPALLDRIAARIERVSERSQAVAQSRADVGHLAPWTSDAVAALEERIVHAGTAVGAIRNTVVSGRPFYFSRSDFQTAFTVIMHGMLAKSTEQSVISISSSETQTNVSLAFTCSNSLPGNIEILSSYNTIMRGLLRVMGLTPTIDQQTCSVMLEFEVPALEATAEHAFDPSRPRRILIVDDDDALRDLLEDILESRNFGVTCCPDAIDALSRMNAEHFDLVITDHGLPKMSGLEFAERLKKMNATVPVIMITGWGSEVEDDVHSVVDHVLPKPFNLASLLGLVENSLQVAPPA